MQSGRPCKKVQSFHINSIPSLSKVRASLTYSLSSSKFKWIRAATAFSIGLYAATVIPPHSFNFDSASFCVHSSPMLFFALSHFAVDSEITALMIREEAERDNDKRIKDEGG